MIKAINTKYKGYYFRSRLEARWAVYFDTLGIKWEYEREGFNLGEYNYLPDFWFPDLEMFAEVKPKEFTDDEERKARLLVKETRFHLLKLVGVPERKTYFSIEINDMDEFWECEYILSNYHNYPRDERRFYSMPGYDEEVNEEWFDDIDTCVEKAKSARFENNREVKDNDSI